MNVNSSKEEKILIGNDEILYKDIANFFIRNARKLVTILGIGLSISLIYTLRLKNVWQGEFQIVLDNEESNLRSTAKLPDANFDFLVKNNSSLNTQIEILKSQSILMPIYNSFILREKNQSKNKVNSFRGWKKNLDIDLIIGTNVLNIKYKNTDKDSILPILYDISKVYQKYSTENLNNELTKGINYLNNQIKIYRQKSNISYENAQKFALENDLQVVSSSPSVLLNNLNNPIPNNNLNFRDQRIESAKKKRLFYQIAQYFEDDDSDNEKLLYLAINNGLVENSLLEELSNIQSKINSSKDFFTDNYSVIKNLERQREALLEIIKKKSLKTILARIDLADAVIESTKRPDGVYIKSTRLNNEYLRDSYTLLDLESQLKLIKLEKAKEPEPYKLITNPTLLDRKIAPSKSRVLLFHGLFWITFTILYIYFEEKIKDTLYSPKEIQNLVPYYLLEKIPSNYSEKWDDYLYTISNFYFKNSKIEILKLGDFDEQLSDLFLSKLKSINPDIEIKIINNISEVNYNNNLVLLIQSGMIKREELVNFKRRFEYGEFNIMGWILFEETNSTQKT